MYNREIRSVFENAVNTATAVKSSVRLKTKQAIARNFCDAGNAEVTFCGGIESMQFLPEAANRLNPYKFCRKGLFRIVYPILGINIEIFGLYIEWNCETISCSI